MDTHKENKYQKQFYIREKQRYRLLFQHAIKHGLSSLTLVKNNEEKIKLIEFYKKRLDFPYVFGNLHSMRSKGLYIYTYNDNLNNLNIQEFQSVGISNENINYNVSDLLKRASSFDIPVLITKNNSNIKNYFNADLSRNVSIDYPEKSQYLENEEIREQFLNTFTIAEDEINIISPWMNENVIDNKLVALIANALERGVVIKIIYGIGNKDDNRSKRSDNIAYKLKRRFNHYGDRVLIKKSNTHIKMLLCDNKYMMMGSYNFLSFRGDYQGDDLRKETVKYQVDSVTIAQERLKYFSS